MYIECRFCLKPISSGGNKTKGLCDIHNKQHIGLLLCTPIALRDKLQSILIKIEHEKFKIAVLHMDKYMASGCSTQQTMESDFVYSHLINLHYQEAERIIAALREKEDLSTRLCKTK